MNVAMTGVLGFCAGVVVEYVDPIFAAVGAATAAAVIGAIQE